MYTDESSVYDVLEAGWPQWQRPHIAASVQDVEERGTSLPLKYLRWSGQHATHRKILIHHWSPLSLDQATRTQKVSMNVFYGTDLSPAGTSCESLMMHGRCVRHAPSVVALAMQYYMVHVSQYLLCNAPV